ncbi:alkaline phosphatase family protein [Brevibacillus dissolubilis]|uniref:alkaline phosphatase family protein n=1 Tax=Brevibacillus dissolubilis TaxID=1844116 RepID=UPI0011178FD9|nr:alkaline phosphatase family protein [Brevibacillus dissolubilis]
MKKVLLFLVDSMMPKILDQCITQGKAPAFQFLIEKGQYINDCVTVFPTMTASIDCSLITGVYPDEHKVPGLVWYDPSTKKIINYINGAFPVYSLGLDHCGKNVLFDLNERHMSKDVKTIHEELEERGYTSGSINVIAHRGHKKHETKIPFLLDAATRFRLKEKVSGPTILSMGTLIKPEIFRPINWNWSQSIVSSYGLNDAYAIDVLIEVIKSGQQPDFTLIYLPDNDHKLHRSPSKAVDHLSQVDKEVARFLDSYDSWDEAIEKNVCIFVSDHGQTIIGTSKEHNIYLDKLLASLKIHKFASTPGPDDEIVICNNERMCFIYPLHPEVQPKLIDLLVQEPNIEVIAWKEEEWVNVRRGGSPTKLSFKKEGPFVDIYQTNWSIEGDFSILDLQQQPDGTIYYDDYPDAMARLYGALFAQEIPVVAVSATPSYEFVSECSPQHLGGGSHGSLHKIDSIVPLIMAGSDLQVPKPARLVDLKAFIMEKLLLPDPLPV